MSDDPQALANVETYLVNFLENSNPRRDASHYNITEAAQDHHDTTGNWDVEAAGSEAVEGLLARHGK